MTWPRLILLWTTLLALALAPASASARAIVIAKTHVGVIDVAAALCIEAASCASLGEYRENPLAEYDGTSDVPHVAGGEAPGGRAGTRRKNRIPDVGRPGAVVPNPSGTTTKKYGPDGHVQKEFNKGHTGKGTPKTEQSDHIHDYKPNPRHPQGRPDRQPGRPPRNRDLKELDRL